MSQSSDVYVITGVQTGRTGEAVPLRLEIDTWYPGQTVEHVRQNSLFLHALRLLQEKNPEEKISFFQIGGIHGSPYMPWDEDTDAVTANEGYCTHDSILFPTWHRPYMALYEQALYEIMVNEVIPQIPAVFQKEYKDAAATWRLPYWDWAQKKTRLGFDDPVYDAPLIVKEPKIAVLDLKTGAKSMMIDNPTYKFTMPNGERMGCCGISDVQDTDASNKITTIPFSTSTGTSRWAPYEPQSGTVSQQWIEGTVDNTQIADALNSHPWYGTDVDQVPVAEMVYRLYLDDYIKSYTQFATTKFKGDDQDDPAPYLNLEYIHNNIHNWSGGFDKFIGHMTEVLVAGFDPIFFMHHANVDRQLALWQGVHLKDDSKNWFQDPSQQLKDDGTWSIPTDDIDTPSTGLAPFHKDASGNYLTSDDVRDWTKLGYSYPELQPWLDKYLVDGKFDPDLYVADVKKQLQTLYRPTRVAKPEKPVAIPRALDAKNWTDDVIINVTYDRFAFSGAPYTIHLFLGSPAALSRYTGPLHQHPQHVGYIYTFSSRVVRNRAAPGCVRCRRKAAEGTRSRAQVPITGQLVARIHAKDELEKSVGSEWGRAVLGGEPHGVEPLAGLGVGEVERYLERCLHWRVRAQNGQDLEIPEEKPFVEISVYHRQARFDDAKSEARYRRLKRPTRAKRGGYGFTRPSIS